MVARALVEVTRLEMAPRPSREEPGNLFSIKVWRKCAKTTKIMSFSDLFYKEVFRAYSYKRWFSGSEPPIRRPKAKITQLE